MPGLFQFRVAKKRCPGSAAASIELFLVRKFCTTAIDQPDQRYIKALGKVGNSQDIL